VIEVPVSTAVLVFLLVTVALVLVVWVLFGWRRRGRLLTTETDNYIWRCPICNHVYLETRPERYSKCPQCGSMNTNEESEKVDLKDDSKEHGEDEV
jgi:phage FluMu protein Com